MSSHAFVFEPGVWEGEGKISFSMADDELDFVMVWRVSPKEAEKIFFNQTITIDELGQEMNNQFSLSLATSKNFHVALENGLIGRVEGKGVIDPEMIAWEFRDKAQQFEGFEVYELQEDGSYKMHAEFSSGDGLRTYVRGQIRKNRL